MTVLQPHVFWTRFLYGDQARFFEDEIRPHLKHTKKGCVGMASAGENMNASQFYITTSDEIVSLDGKHTVCPFYADHPLLVIDMHMFGK